MQTVYIEKSILNHTRTQRILARLKPHYVIECDHYKEVFNPKSQNFRIQKQNPSLILAEKKGRRILETPEGFGIGGEKNYYFSHMLNCLYDCRYCFLQGMYSSAHYVLFVNYEDFMDDIRLMDQQSEKPLYFFSGYDCDSLVFEPISHFLREFLPFFKNLKQCILELRTKSANIKELLNHSTFNHCVVAFSFTPDEISREIELKVPSVKKRIAAMKKVAEKGWKIGLRFDPLIYHVEFKSLYQNLMTSLFQAVNVNHLHSISVGALRFPEKMYQTIKNLYPNDKLLAHPLYRQNKVFSYQKELEQTMKKIIYDLLKNYIDTTLIFECQNS